MNEEDEIIQKGLKSHTKQDTLCYLGMVILFIMIFIPPIFRVVFAGSRPKSTIEDVIYLTLTCRSGYQDNNGTMVTKTIEGKYRNGEIRSIRFTFNYYADQPNADDPEQAELLDLSKSLSDLKRSVNSNEISYDIDFAGKAELKQRQELQSYTMNAPAQLNAYRNLGFSCDNESETKTEDTAKWKD